MKEASIDLDEYERLIAELHGEIQEYGSLRRDLVSMVGLLDQVRSAQASHSERLEGLAGQASSLLSELQPLKDAVEGSLGRQEAAGQSLAREISEQLGETTSSLTNAFTDLNTRMETAAARTEVVAARVEAVSAQIAALPTKSDVEALQTSMASLAAELSVVRSRQQTLLILVVTVVLLGLVIAFGTFF